MKKSILMFAAFAFIFGCSKKEEPSPDAQIEQTEQVEVEQTEQSEQASLPHEKIIIDEKDFVNKDIEKIDLSGYLSQFRKNAQNSAHSVYLNDEVEFSSLPATPDFEKILMAGNDLCVLFNKVPKNDNEFDSLKRAGIKIPKGTLLNYTGEKIENEDGEFDGLFLFEENYNYFYPVEYDGKPGFVFGADVCGQDGNITYEQMILLSFLYQHATNDDTAYFENFYPICGYKKFDAQIANSLKENRIALQNVLQYEYDLSIDHPDDMIALYQKHGGTPFRGMGRNIVPVFITTDLFAHSQHLVFDRLLQHVEQEIFSPRLILLTEKFREKISEDLQKYPSNETANIAEKYFAVASALLKLAPSVDNYGNEKAMPDKDLVLSEYGEEIRKEVEKIFKADAMQGSSALSFSDGSSYIEDYTQYKPRGHYTQNERLKAYFRAMMWFGRINFPLPESSRDSSDPSESLARNMFKIGIYINDIIMQDDSLYELWKSVFEPITVLIGESDDLSFDDLIPLWKSVNAENVLEWISDENVANFASLSREKLKSPLITSTSAFYANQGEGDYSNPENIKPAMGWRFLGQRFTYDAWIFQHVTSPRLYGRMMASGLDIASAFGSNSADMILEDATVKKSLGLGGYGLEDIDENFGKTIFEELKKILGKFKKFFGSKDEKFWSETYYNSVLALTKAQAEFEQGAGFFFTEKPLWNIKSLESSLGTWAELKHDTILYTKQIYAEKGGGGESWDPTYRTDKLPSPVHYIEPNLKFFTELCVSWKVFQNIFERYKLFDDDSKYAVSSMEEISLRALNIVAAEVKDEKVSKDDLDWIGTIPQLLAKSVVPFSTYASYADNNEQFKMALVTDVLTNAESGSVLEVAVGIPHRIYVALNDKQGGKRIAVGYTFNYYEFTHPMNDRLTDEQWKKMVYEKGEEAAKRKPQWYFDSTIEANGFGGRF